MKVTELGIGISNSIPIYPEGNDDNFPKYVKPSVFVKVSLTGKESENLDDSFEGLQKIARMFIVRELQRQINIMEKLEKKGMGRFIIDEAIILGMVKEEDAIKTESKE